MKLQVIIIYQIVGQDPCDPANFFNEDVETAKVSAYYF